MLKMSRKPSKKLAKVVLATLMFTGGAQLAISPSVVEATELTVNSVTKLSVRPWVSWDTDPAGANLYDGAYGTYYPEATVTVLNLKEGVTQIGGFCGGETGSKYDAATGTTTYTSGDVTGHTVNVRGAAIRRVFGGSASVGDATNNTANVFSGSVVGGTDTWNGVYGGSAWKGSATGNHVNISGGTVTGGSVTGYIFGGHADGDTGFAGTVAADDNHIVISGGNVGLGDTDFYIYGGYVKKRLDPNVSTAPSSSASGNSVTIKNDANIGANTYIYGGNAFDYYYDSSSNKILVPATAANNTVNILKAITVKGLYGGIGDETKSTGNTLNIAAKGVVANDVAAFQNMNFYLPSDIANGDTMLTIKGNEGMTTPAYLKGVTFGVAALSGVNLQKGNTVNLVVGNNGLTTDDTLKTTDSATLAKAEFLSANSLTTDNKYELSISKKGEDTIIATVDNVTEQKADEGGSGEKGGSGKKAVSIPDVLKSPVETRAGVVTLVNAGADLLISQGMSNAADAAAAERTEGDAAAAPRAGGFAPFAAVSFGKLRAESGSHVDNKGIGMNLGFAREIANKNGKLLVGPVIEYGHGSYDSYQDSGIKADGKSSYWGIGVIAKQTNDNGFYYEGSLRAGRTKSDYNSDLRPGLHVNYDSSATYWAAHLGVGKLVDIGHDNTLDYYGKYFYSHTGSDSTYLNGANETANFDAVNSHRIRLGARLTHALNEKNKIYGGLAWQYEFKGDARATYSVSGEAPSPSVKGSSGMIELGWQVKPGKSPMTIDLGVTGWVGKQRGITANLQANWTF